MSDLQWIFFFFSRSRKASQLVVLELLKWKRPSRLPRSRLPSSIPSFLHPQFAIDADCGRPGCRASPHRSAFRSAVRLVEKVSLGSGASPRRGKSAEIIIRPSSKQTGFLEVTAGEDARVWAWTVNSSPCSCWRRKHCSLSTSRRRFGARGPSGDDSGWAPQQKTHYFTVEM